MYSLGGGTEMEAAHSACILESHRQGFKSQLSPSCDICDLMPLRLCFSIFKMGTLTMTPWRMIVRTKGGKDSTRRLALWPINAMREDDGGDEVSEA